jgi:hypothetical protein
MKKTVVCQGKMKSKTPERHFTGLFFLQAEGLKTACSGHPQAGATKAERTQI